ncbi:unnamed protein product [Oppiella nova]|uniref:GOLD domain-containing protein n=1 Tax=Oppiella nova TaxID=334625 RepID=A0A7R9LUN1_9ACAR|nr:unnamed protein product [Oppiella nova]CAG2167036.1 unnamed protein product [Oppiella nova]
MCRRVVSKVLRSVLAVIVMAGMGCYGMSCVDESGTAIDWFIVYKMPKLEKSSSKSLTTGFSYSFITDKSIKSLDDWTLSDKQINEEDSIFGQTIGPLIKKLAKSSSDVSYVVYNDQSPDSSTSSGAHSKGLFAIDSSGGFWLRHSVPRFPSLHKPYDFPHNAKHNGQTALCISLSAKDTQSINNIVFQLLVMRPNIYGSDIQDALIAKSDLWLQLKNKKWFKNETQSQLLIQTKNRLVLTSFAKSSKYEKDLYSGLIAPHFMKDLLVQSWRNGAGEKLPSDCKDTYKVQNVDKIQIPDQSVKDIDWEYTEDHSKWGITSDKAKAYTCIADINRMKSQFKRGGGGMCISSDKVWHIFMKSIEQIEGCQKSYYSLCIDNTVSRFASKLVSLYVASFKRDEWEKYIQELTDHEVTVGNFTNSLRTVDNNIGLMIKSLDHSRRVNSADWYLVDGNNRYVQNWSIISIIIIIISSVVQVLFVKKLFDSKDTFKGKPRA